MSAIRSVSEYLERKFTKEIKAHHQLEPQPAQTYPFPSHLHPQLSKVLRSQGIDQLYSHQQEAFDPITHNQDCVLVSQTASGKTLSLLTAHFKRISKQPHTFWRFIDVSDQGVIP